MFSVSIKCEWFSFYYTAHVLHQFTTLRISCLLQRWIKRHIYMFCDKFWMQNIVHEKATKKLMLQIGFVHYVSGFLWSLHENPSNIVDNKLEVDAHGAPPGILYLSAGVFQGDVFAVSGALHNGDSTLGAALVCRLGGHLALYDLANLQWGIWTKGGYVKHGHVLTKNADDRDNCLRSHHLIFSEFYSIFYFDLYLPLLLRQLSDISIVTNMFFYLWKLCLFSLCQLNSWPSREVC